MLAVGQPVHSGLNRGHAERREFVAPILWGWPYLPYVYYPFDTADLYNSDDISPYMNQAQPGPLQQTDPSGQAVSAYPPQYAPSILPELQHLVLVKRDGEVLQAVAFIATADRVTYVTPDGLRRYFPLSDLDKDATRVMNEANGNSISLPE